VPGERPSDLGRVDPSAERLDLALLARRLAMDRVLKALQERLEVVQSALEHLDATRKGFLPRFATAAGRLSLIRVLATPLDDAIQQAGKPRRSTSGGGARHGSSHRFASARRRKRDRADDWFLGVAVG
jgi:hypothetical protein